MENVTLQGVADSLESHIKQQKIYEDKQSVMSDKILNKLNEVMPLAKEVSDFKTFFRIGRNIGLGTAILITTIGIILGGIYTIKEWLKR